MTTWPARDPLPRSGSSPEPVDQTGEPVGYDLEAEAVYEQPPAPPQPFRLPPPPTARPADVSGGFTFTLLGLCVVAFIPLVGLGLSGAGAMACAVSMIRSRRGRTINRGLAIAGIVLGLVGFALALLLMMDFSLGYEVGTPS